MPNGIQGKSILRALMLVCLLIAILISPGIPVTLDEPVHYHYGLLALEGKTDRIDDGSLPVCAIDALPGYLPAALTIG